jgi:hypothetical protein
MLPSFAKLGKFMVEELDDADTVKVARGIRLVEL